MLSRCKQIFSYFFLISSLLLFNFTSFNHAYAITDEDIENSEEYYQKRAIFREIKTEDKWVHEISIGGLVISDLHLTELIGEEQLFQNLQNQQKSQQLLFGSLSGGGFLLGGILLAYSNTFRKPTSLLQPQTNQLSGVYINGQRFEGNTPAFIAGIIGSLLTILGLLSALQFIYEMTGLNKSSLLDNKVAKELVDKYNKQLKAKIKAKFILEK